MPRGSFPSSAAGAFTSLGRLILDRLDRGVILLDRHRRVQDAAALARRVLAARNGVTIRRGRFVFLDPAVDDRLSQLVQALAVSPSGGARAMAAQIRHNRSPPYRVLVSPVPPDADEHRVLLFVLIYGPREWRDISIDLSRNTVRTHLKQIFSRCEVRSQRELLHLLATGPQDL